MALECPVCRARVSFFRAFRTTAWGRFPCASCRSILGIDVKRRFMTLIPFIPAMLLLTTVIPLRQYGGIWLFYGTVIVTFLLLLRLCERIVVIDERAFNCRHCGYDLRGLTEPRCPECGTSFDPTEKERILARAGDPTPLARYRWILPVLIVLLGALIVFGTYLANRPRGPLPTAAPGAPPTQNSAIP